MLFALDLKVTTTDLGRPIGEQEDREWVSKKAILDEESRFKTCGC